MTSKIFHLYLKKAALEGSILPLQKSFFTGKSKNYKKGDGYLRWWEVTCYQGMTRLDDQENRGNWQ